MTLGTTERRISEESDRTQAGGGEAAARTGAW
jgi:hypothetical protein